MNQRDMQREKNLPKLGLERDFFPDHWSDD